MIDIRRQPDGVYRVRVSGPISRADVVGAWEKVREATATGEKIKVLEIIESFSGISLEALVEDLKHGLPMMERVSQAAVVTDEAWLRGMTDLADHFVGAEVRAFRMNQMDEARRWLGMV